MKKGVSWLLVSILVASLCPTKTADFTIKATTAKNHIGTTYYLDSNSGQTNGDGLSPQSAFDSLADVNHKTFKPGDRLLIKANSKFKGTLWPKGSGKPGQPIIIDMYGTGAKPQIDANGSYFVKQTKDWQGPFTGKEHNQIGAAVYLYNQQYVEINNLDVKNTGDNTDRDRSGIRIEGYDAGVLNHIYIRNCNIHDVRGFNGQDDIYPVIPTNPDGSPVDGYTNEDQSKPNTTNTFWGARTTHRTGGINLVTYTARLPEKNNKFNVPVQELDSSKKITRFNDVIIEDNTIENCQANGITTTNVKGSLDDTAFRHTNVIIRDNYIHNVTRSGIIPLYTSGALVEHNKVDTFQSTTAGYGCGIWCDRANGMIFQYNEVSHGQNGNDGMAFNLDDMTRDGIIQYNYTHDNYGGGYMLHIRQNSYNQNNTIRYNLSINDSGIFADHNAQIVAVGENKTTKLKNAQVYNNTFISNKDCHAVFSGDQVAYTNNIWYFTNPKVATRQKVFAPGENSTFNNNAYYGCQMPNDPLAKTADPQFVGGKNLFKLDQKHAYAYAMLKTTSPYLNAGITVNNNGNQDILAQPLTNNNLGAFAGVGHQVAPSAQTISALDATKFLADGSQQTEVISETAAQAQQKWVNTTFNNENVIYTKKQGNYLQIPFTGNGGILRLKRGPQAGKVKVSVSSAKSRSTIFSQQYNTQNTQADILTINDLANLTTTNTDLILTITNSDTNKATNFINFTSQVTPTEVTCPNDHLAGIVLEKLPIQSLATPSLAIPLKAHVFYATCKPDETPATTLSYQVSGDGQIKDNLLIVTKPGTYYVTATAHTANQEVKTTLPVIVEATADWQAPVDFSNLQTLLRQYQALDLTKYLANQDLNHFKQLLQKAEQLSKNPTATQAQVDQMVINLKQAYQKLQLKITAASTIKQVNLKSKKQSAKRLPQTGNQTNLGLVFLGSSLLVAVLAVICKRIKF